jgi:ATP-dependent DNA ligase
MGLPIAPTYPPMEAKLVDELPTGSEWWYEPKWDGFRCLAFRDGAHIDLMSKAQKPLTRYFPEVADALLASPARRFVLDGELVVPIEQQLSFDALLQRIHPAESRVRKLAAEWPAELIVFDLLVDDEAGSLVGSPLAQRRRDLEAFVGKAFPDSATVRLSPMTDNIATARVWLQGEQTGLDGVVAKRHAMTYQSGERTGMEKVKNIRTADCVVGGFRYASKGGGIGSLLLGLYDDAGRLDHVGFTSSFTATQRVALRETVEPLVEPPGFTGRAPGGPSRWSTNRTTEWQPLAPTLVVEVSYDHFSDGRFRHGTTFRRWRPDKRPDQCTFGQLPPEGRSALRLLRLR